MPDDRSTTEAMAKAEDKSGKALKQGDEVEWSTSQGTTKGKVKAVKTSDFSVKGTDLKASKDDPKVLIESEKSGKEAGHKPGSVKKT